MLQRPVTFFQQGPLYTVHGVNTICYMCFPILRNIYKLSTKSKPTLI